MKPKPVAQTILPWLKANLGARCLAPLTGTDARALAAAVSIIDLYSYDRDPAVLEAFARIVGRMQRCSKDLAFHAIAHVMEWSDRDRIWAAAGLPMAFVPRRCEFEPGGARMAEVPA